MEHLTGFAQVASRYDGFILDLWGVIHDGVTPYAGAKHCLEQLRAMGRPVVLLSNAPRRAHVAQHALRGMGIADSLYTDIMTSGEASHILLRDRPDAWAARLGRTIYHIGPERDRNVFEGLDLRLVDRPADADFVINTGPDDLGDVTVIDPWLPALAECLAAGLPMLCANPDLEVIRSGGVRAICAGLLAQHYEAGGGDVRWIGKPDAAIYHPVLAMLGVDRRRVLAVGDALRTDIAGATAAGIDSCWVLGGIHGEELGHDPVLVERTAQAAGLAPIAAVPSFIW